MFYFDIASELHSLFDSPLDSAESAISSPKILRYAKGLPVPILWQGDCSGLRPVLNAVVTEADESCKIVSCNMRYLDYT